MPVRIGKWSYRANLRPTSYALCHPHMELRPELIHVIVGTHAWYETRVTTHDFVQLLATGDSGCVPAPASAEWTIVGNRPLVPLAGHRGWQGAD